MASKDFKNQILDVRPDRLDLRDREYRPPLKDLPPQYPAAQDIAEYLRRYTDSKMILDQKSEGACTGFGLAAVVNYLRWTDALKEYRRDFDEALKEEKLQVHVNQVSERMLYHMAKIYDEWEGEDYDGSSCRGAMKGWHKHGICDKQYWPYLVRDKPKFVAPREGWSENAAQTPLGAYYRINKDSIGDMQSAIVEVGAIYCSSLVHQGWYKLPKRTKTDNAEISNSIDLPVIPNDNEMAGGHAFALVGYNAEGFIIQNSWGQDWGYKGFALLSYQDWNEFGMDAWVAVRGAATNCYQSSESTSMKSLQQREACQSRYAGVAVANTANSNSQSSAVETWTEEQAYRHTVVLGNNGRPILKLITTENADESIKRVVSELPAEWMEKSAKNRKIAIYAHGGLNDESASIKRIRVLAPYFKANGIYPIFISWRTGVLESGLGILEDGLFGDDGRSGFSLESISEWLKERADRAIEFSARRLGVKMLWDEMKQNADKASCASVPGAFGGGTRKGGMVLVAEQIGALQETFPDLELHLVGHSAGSILFGHWLDVLTRKSMQVNTLTLFAPACSVEFANKHYKGAAENNTIKKNNLYLDIMSDERELADSVGPYHKSLLYLVSRALEDMHKMPILGMEASWDPEHELWMDSQQSDTATARERRKHIESWMAFAKTIKPKVDDQDRTVYDKSQSKVRTSSNNDLIDLAHGSFDNDIDVIGKTLARIKGSKTKVEIASLIGF